MATAPSADTAVANAAALNVAGSVGADGSGGGGGVVLLYYKYVDLAGREGEVAAWYRAWGAQREEGAGAEAAAGGGGGGGGDAGQRAPPLVGRVRVAADGVNVTVGGSAAAVDAHIAAVRAHPLLRGGDIDFKVAPAAAVAAAPLAAPPGDGGGSDAAAAAAVAAAAAAAHAAMVKETGFDRLTVAVRPELVSLGRAPAGSGCGGAGPLSGAARHVSPSEFHEMLLRARGGGGGGGGGGDGADHGSDDAPLVLLDVRNAYETAIGRFEAPGVPLLDPRTRAFAELPAFFDAHAADLAGKRVLMYCTGGVRCERASALLRARGVARDVAQLRGGVQRYLEAYPDGGLFKGRLFVYDPRGSVAPPLASAAGGGNSGSNSGGGASAAGECIGCGAPQESYERRARCGGCRQLVLVCGRCDAAAAKAARGGKKRFTCALCRERCYAVASSGGGAGGTAGAGRKLRILCLHGFRSSAHSFKRRARELCRALAGSAELVFVDAPHALPLWYRAAPAVAEAAAAAQATVVEAEAAGPRGVHAARSCSSAGDGSADGTDGGDGDDSSAPPLQPPPPPPRLPPAVHKRCWLLPPELVALSARIRAGAEPAQWTPAPEGAIPSGSGDATAAAMTRLTAQTEGGAESLAAIKAALAEHAPIDGVLGHSQGAALATALLAEQQVAQQQQQQQQQQAGDEPGQVPPVRFAILLSGFLSPAPEHRALLEAAGLLRVPSLSVFGGDGGDCGVDGEDNDRGSGSGKGNKGGCCVVPRAASEALARAYDAAAGRVLARQPLSHGHDVPRARAPVAAVARFVEAQRVRLVGGSSAAGAQI